MTRLVTLALLAALTFPSTVTADVSMRAPACPLEGNFKVLPSGIDRESADRLWCWMKHEVRAPLDLSPPPVFVGPLRRDKYSVFIFPTRQAPENMLSIEIAASLMRYEDPLFVLWALGHELTHALFTLRPFRYQEQSAYPMAFPSMQHCDPEFRRVTRGAADLIWSIYHSSRQRSRMLALDAERFGRECAFLSNAFRLRQGS